MAESPISASGHVTEIITLHERNCPDLQNEQSAMKEAASLSKLATHDMKNVNVIQYHEAFIHDDRLCIITELCEHGDLHTEIRRRAALAEHYEEGEVMEIFVQILLGLAHVHNNRIVHRDLKVCRLDFGVMWCQPFCAGAVPGASAFSHACCVTLLLSSRFKASVTM